MWSIKRSKSTGRLMVFHGKEYIESFLTYAEALDFIKVTNRSNGYNGYDLTF